MHHHLSSTSSSSTCSSSTISKSFYLDRLGNMSTSSSMSSGVMGGAASSIDGSIGCRKQILTLKPKPQPSANGYVQHLEFKEKDLLAPPQAAPAPVTMLALKKKEKLDKNVVTMLAYRKPASSSTTGSTSSASSSSAFEHHLNAAHQNHLINMHHLMNQGGQGMHRPSSPNSSGYDSDSLVEQENCDVFTSLLNSASYAYNNGLMMMAAPEHIHHDMLHSHPVWSPQIVGVKGPKGMNNVNNSQYFHRENENKFLVQ